MLCGKSLPVHVRIIGEGQQFRQHHATIFCKMDHRHAGVGHVEMGSKHGIRNIQHTAENGQTHSLMGKQSDPLLIFPDGMVAILLQIMPVAQGFQKRIRFPLDPLNTLTKTGGV